MGELNPKVMRTKDMLRTRQVFDANMINGRITR